MVHVRVRRALFPKQGSSLLEKRVETQGRVVGAVLAALEGPGKARCPWHRARDLPPFDG